MKFIKSYVNLNPWFSIEVHIVPGGPYGFLGVIIRFFYANS